MAGQPVYELTLKQGVNKKDRQKLFRSPSMAFNRICNLLIPKDKQELAAALWEMVNPPSKFDPSFADTVVSESPHEAVQKKHEREEKPRCL